MKALTILQPWASCITDYGKRIENRSWRPTAALLAGERFAIHAGKAFDSKGWDALLKNRALVGPGSGVMSYAGALMLSSNNQRIIPRGAVVATACIERVVESSDSPWFVGPLGWVLRDVRVFSEPVPCKGRQRLWNLSPDVEARVLALEPTEEPRA